MKTGVYMKHSEFFAKVYEIAARNPSGKVMTYGQIAAWLDAPNCARRVGQAMYHAPAYLDIPAHRVVNSRGELAPASVFGGEGIQKRMLESEGVVFKQNGCIDLKKCILRMDH
jgi:methylated-DNA-protein-cysteine methyltransferase-like protein